MMRILLAALPASLALSGFEVDEGISLLQLQMNRTSIQPGSMPGPNPIVTMDECRQKAAELGMPLGAPDSGVGFEVPASGYFTKGCFCYRICQKGQYASGHYRWRVFYGVVTPGQDVTPEEAAQPTGGAAPNQNSRQQVAGTQDQQQRIDVPLHLVDLGGCTEEEKNLIPMPVPAAPESADEGEAVGDPHITHAGHHYDLDQSHLHH